MLWLYQEPMREISLMGSWLYLADFHLHSQCRWNVRLSTYQCSTDRYICGQIRLTETCSFLKNSAHLPHWPLAPSVKFLAEERIQEMTGPSTTSQWLYWQYKSPEQKKRCAIITELDKLLAADPVGIQSFFFYTTLSNDSFNELYSIREVYFWCIFRIPSSLLCFGCFTLYISRPIFRFAET